METNCVICNKTLDEKIYSGNGAIIGSTLTQLECGHCYHTNCFDMYVKEQLGEECIICGKSIPNQLYVWDLHANPCLELYEHFKNDEYALNYKGVFFDVAFHIYKYHDPAHKIMNERDIMYIKLFNLMLENNLVNKSKLKYHKTLHEFFNDIFSAICKLHYSQNNDLKEMYDQISNKLGKVYPEIVPMFEDFENRYNF